MRAFNALDGQVEDVLGENAVALGFEETDERTVDLVLTLVRATYHELCGKDGHHRADGFYNAGKHTFPKRPPLALSLRPQRHGDDRPLGEILNGDSKGQDKRACRRDLCVPREEARVHDAYRHALRNVM